MLLKVQTYKIITSCRNLFGKVLLQSIYHLLQLLLYTNILIIKNDYKEQL